MKRLRDRDPQPIEASHPDTYPPQAKVAHDRSFGLDLARAVAIGAVLVSHFSKAQESLGIWGVDIFFGLSGFLIGQILWTSYSSTPDWNFPYIKNFWSRRWWRTLPNYYLFFLIMLPYHRWVDGHLPSLQELVPFLWFGQDFLSRSSSFFGVSWSLCIEEWFYLSFPLVLFVISRFKLKPAVAFAATLAVMFVFCFGVRNMLLDQHIAGSTVRAITMGRLDAIGCGVALAFITAYFGPNKQRDLAFMAVGLLLVGVTFFKVYVAHVPIDTFFLGQYAYVGTALGFAMFLPMLTRMRAPKWTAFSVAIEKLSLWSYSIYLCHIPIMFVCYEVLAPIRKSSAGNLASKIVAIAIAIAVSGLLFHYFELPTTKRRPKPIRNAA